MDSYEVVSRVDRLERQMELRPITAVGTPAQPLVLLQVLDGTDVYDDGAGTVYQGCFPASVLGGVSAHYDPDVDPTPGTFTAEDGIGRAYVYVDGVPADVPVLFALDTSYPIPNALVTGDFVMADGTVSIDDGVGGTIVCYRPVFQ